jgi:hypothetical protein
LSAEKAAVANDKINAQTRTRNSEIHPGKDTRRTKMGASRNSGQQRVCKHRNWSRNLRSQIPRAWELGEFVEGAFL